MRANSPSAVFVSLTLHGFLVAVIFVATIFVARQDKPPPVIFELVAGPPTARDELVAPALGNTPTKLTVNIPKPPDIPAPPEPEVAKPVEPEVRETVVPPKPAPAKPKPDISIARQMKKSEKLSYQDYLKKHPIPKTQPKAAPTKSATVPRIDTQGIAQGVRGGSTANTRGGGGGKALTREEQSEFNTYISFLINALKEAHEPPPGVSDQLEARVTFDITAGEVISNPRIVRSSGNREFDQSVLEAFRRVKSIGPTPNGQSDTWTVTFRMRDE